MSVKTKEGKAYEVSRAHISRGGRRDGGARTGHDPRSQRHLAGQGPVDRVRAQSPSARIGEGYQSPARARFRVLFGGRGPGGTTRLGAFLLQRGGGQRTV